MGQWRYRPTILYFGTRWRWVVSFTHRSFYPHWKGARYQLDRRLGVHEDQSGWHGDKKNHAPTLTRTPNPWVSSMCKSLFQYSPVNFCWFLPAKLFLVSGTVGTYDQSFFHSKTIHVFGNTLSSLTRGGVGLFVKALQLLLRNFAQIYPHSHIVQVRVLVLLGYHACYVNLLHWMEFMQDIHRISVNASLSLGLNLCCHFNRPT